MSGFDRLTKTESEIMKMMAAGMSSKEIAEARCNSINTVRSHQKSIMLKLDVRTQLKAVAMYHRQEVIEKLL